MNLSFDEDGHQSHNETAVDSGQLPPAIIASMLLIGVFVSASNAMVIILFTISRKIRSSMNIFVLNLAVVDLQNGLIALPLTAFYQRSNPSLVTSELYGMPVGLCNFITNWPTVLVTASFLSVSLISVDRTIAIVNPFRYTELVTRGRSCFAIAVVWIWAILITFYPTFGFEAIESEGVVYYRGCDGYYKYTIAYVAIWAFGVNGVALVVVLVSYCIMYSIARRHIAQMKALTVASFRDQIEVASTRAAKTTFIMTSLYVICWVPFLVSIYAGSVCAISDCSGLFASYAQDSIKITATFAFLQSGLNPIIYSLRTPEIRQLLDKKCCCHKKKVSPSVGRPSSDNTEMSLCDM